MIPFITTWIHPHDTICNNRNESVSHDWYKLVEAGYVHLLEHEEAGETVHLGTQLHRSKRARRRVDVAALLVADLWKHRILGYAEFEIILITRRTINVIRTNDKLYTTTHEIYHYIRDIPLYMRYTTIYETYNYTRDIRIYISWIEMLIHRC